MESRRRDAINAAIRNDVRFLEAALTDCRPPSFQKISLVPYCTMNRLKTRRVVWGRQR